MPPSSARVSLTGRDDHVVLAVAALAAVGGALAPGTPTGVAAADLAYRAAASGGLVLLTARARRWTWLVLAATAVATARGSALVPAGLALALALAASARRTRLRLVGAVVAALAGQVLLRQTSWAPTGVDLAIGLAAAAPAAWSGYRRCQPWTRRRLRLAAVGTAAVAVVAAAAAGAAVALALGPLRAGAGDARQALTQARAGATDEAGGDLAAARRRIERATGYLDAPWLAPARLVPGLSQQVAALRGAADSGAQVGRAGEALAEVGDYRDLKVRDGAIDLDRVEALRTPLGATAVVLREHADALAALDRTWLLPPLRTELDTVTEQLDRAAQDADLAAEVVDALPGLLGGDGTRRYLVAFLNPAEQRALGGFVGSYGELHAADGQVRLVRTGSSAQVEATPTPRPRTLDGPAEYLAVHGRANSADLLRDASSSPHFPHSAAVMAQIVAQTRGTPIDGVIAMDAHAVAALLRLTGPIRVDGHPEPISSDNAVDLIVRQQYLDHADTNQDRKDLLEAATERAFEELLAGDLPSPARLARVLGPLVEQRRLLLHADRSAEQALAVRLGADGALPSASRGDTLLVAHQNLGNSKIDAYLRRTVRYATALDARDGSVRATATITLVNEAPPDGLPDYVIGNSRGAPPGTNLMHLLVYSRLRPLAVRVDGEREAFAGDEEAGLQVAALPVAVPPGGTVEVVVDLSGVDDLGAGPYEVRVIPQPMIHDDRVELAVTVDHGVGRPVPAGEAGAALECHGATLGLAPRPLDRPVTVAVAVTGDP